VRSIRLVLEYDGTAFHGWQRQKGMASVQGAVEAALGRVLRRPVSIVGASRTDAGCHAKAQVASFSTSTEIELGRLRRSLNGLLGESITVLDVSEAPPGFHARFDALSRRYSYLIVPGRSALWRRRAWCIEEVPRVQPMQEAAGVFLGRHDCGSFAVRRRQLKNTVCDVLDASWREWPGGLKFEIEADRFLPGMIRSMVWILVRLGLSELDPEAISDMISGRSVPKSHVLAPAEGLYLECVRYPEFCYEPRI